MKLSCDLFPFVKRYTQDKILKVGLQNFWVLDMSQVLSELGAKNE